MMRERIELGFQGEEMRDACVFAAKSLPEIKFQKMAEQTNDVLSFFYVFEKTCTLHGIQVARILPSLLNEKAKKNYSRLESDTCRSYDYIKNNDFERFSSESEGLCTEISNDEALR